MGFRQIGTGIAEAVKNRAAERARQSEARKIAFQRSLVAMGHTREVQTKLMGEYTKRGVPRFLKSADFKTANAFAGYRSKLRNDDAHSLNVRRKKIDKLLTKRETILEVGPPANPKKISRLEKRIERKRRVVQKVRKRKERVRLSREKFFVKNGETRGKRFRRGTRKTAFFIVTLPIRIVFWPIKTIGKALLAPVLIPARWIGRTISKPFRRRRGST